MRGKLLGLATCALMTASLVLTGSAQAVQSPQTGTVTADPANGTPHVLDGEVYAVAEVGNTIVLGGKFTSARNAPDGSPTLARSNLLAFDKTTGLISQTFAPVVNNAVRSLVASPDGVSVYVGGQFGSIDGRISYKLARLNVTTGQPVAGFNPGRIDAAVMDVRLNGDRLFIGGQFTIVGGQPRTYLAELSPQTGAVHTNVNLAINTPVWSGIPFVAKNDVSPDGTRMVVLGNFRSIGGQARSQVAMLDLTTNPVTVMSWASPVFDIKCGSSQGTGFDVRDVDFSPDGSYFVIGATGGHTAVGAVCDAVTRWETNRTGPGQQPTWIDMTGGDSVYSVASTGSAIYAGGHFRWFNNPVYVQSYKGPGAVDREGLAALDPVTGVPLKWNPGRDRGQAVWDLLATPTGLWVGNDTDRIGRYEYHARIAFFPLAGGSPVPQPVALPLPVDTQLVAPATAPDGLVRRRSFTGTTAGSEQTVGPAGTGWSAVRGAFVAEGSLYAVRTDKTMTKQAVSGDTYGPRSTVNLNGLSAFADELPAVTSMFYSDGRLYYTLGGQNSLYMRFFTVESDIVGATRFTVVGGITGVDWTTIRGAFLVQGQLYVAGASTGILTRVTWTDGAPVSGTAIPVSGPAINGIDWRSSALFVRPPTSDPVASNISFVGLAANTAQVTAVSRAVTVPANAVAGDTLVMFWDANGADTSATAPAGWTPQASAASLSSASTVWTRTALAGDAGSTVAVSTAVALKADLVIAVYRNAQVGPVAMAAESTVRADHTTPALTATVGGSWVVSYWADKSATTTAWTAPAGTVQRHVFAGVGAGHVSELLADSNGPAPTGPTGGLVAVADSAQRNATTATVVLTPTP